MAAAARAGPFAERTAPTALSILDFDRVGCRRAELWRGFALLRAGDVLRAEVVLRAEDVLRAEAAVRPEPVRPRLVVRFWLLV
ncbi:MAG TPA: hypothetical protein VF056_09560 [Thermoleophilaceae bacterium]